MIKYIIIIGLVLLLYCSITLRVLLFNLPIIPYYSIKDLITYLIEKSGNIGKVSGLECTAVILVVVNQC